MGMSVLMKVAQSVPNERVVYEVGSSSLTLEFGDGEITLTHSGLQSADELEGIASGWRTALGLLDHGIVRHADAQRHVRWFIEAAPTSPGCAHVFFTDASALAQWLTKSGAIPADGERCRLQLAWGSHLSGTVLANSPDRDVAVTWHEDADSCLVLRTFPSPRTPSERLLALSWSRYAHPQFPRDITLGLQSSLERLSRVLRRRASA
jgi:hypothetical protein